MVSILLSTQDVNIQNARGLVEAAGLKCDLICSNGACAFDKDGNPFIRAYS